MSSLNLDLTGLTMSEIKYMTELRDVYRKKHEIHYDLWRQCSLFGGQKIAVSVRTMPVESPPAIDLVSIEVRPGASGRMYLFDHDIEAARKYGLKMTMIYTDKKPAMYMAFRPAKE